MSKLVEVNKKIEDAVGDNYQKIEDKFVDTVFTKEDKNNTKGE